MQAIESACNAATAATDRIQSSTRRQNHGATFAKVLDGRKQPIRGLWERNGRFYAQDAILFHLGEAKEELDRTVKEVTDNPEYDIGGFRAAMMHLYHHLNTAWNGRDASADRHRECAQSDFDTWPKFPSNEDLLLD